jgi:hypothetical protein
LDAQLASQANVGKRGTVDHHTLVQCKTARALGRCVRANAQMRTKNSKQNRARVPSCHHKRGCAQQHVACSRLQTHKKHLKKTVKDFFKQILFLVKSGSRSTATYVVPAPQVVNVYCPAIVAVKACQCSCNAMKVDGGREVKEGRSKIAVSAESSEW